MYNLLILMLETNFFPQKSVGYEISTMMCWNQPSVCRFLFLAWSLQCSGDRKECNSSLLILKETECILSTFVSFLVIKNDHRGHANQQI